MSSPLVLGFIASFTLIAAIGAQNAFVLRQGIRREHVLPVVALCTVSDIALISAHCSSSATGCWRRDAPGGPRH
jgi:L-lysine exporter family protein LysE/ArgO